MDECDREARRDILKAAVDAEWTKLWSTGVLNVLHGDDVEDIMDMISTCDGSEIHCSTGRTFSRESRNPGRR